MNKYKQNIPIKQPSNAKIFYKEEESWEELSEEELKEPDEQEKPEEEKFT